MMTRLRRWEVACGVDFSGLMDTTLQAPDRHCAVRRVRDGGTALYIPTLRHYTRLNIEL
jgi:hypothetical protein